MVVAMKFGAVVPGLITDTRRESTCDAAVCSGSESNATLAVGVLLDAFVWEVAHEGSVAANRSMGMMVMCMGGLHGAPAYADGGCE
jgi:hypothetical protein